MSLLQTTFRAGSEEQETPQWLFDELDAEFGFTLDVCAQSVNAKCARYFTPEVDGLRQSWRGETCWMNPPFKRAGEWVERAWYAARREGATVVCLLPAWSDVAWWHGWVLRADQIQYIRGRLKFNGASRAAPMALCLVVFRPGPDPEDGPRLRGGIYGRLKA